MAIKLSVPDKAVAALADKLAAFDKVVAKKAMTAGLNEVTKGVLKEARARVPKRSGQLKKALGRKVVVRDRGRVAYGVVGTRRGYRIVIGGRAVNPVNYAHLVEFGRRRVFPKNKTVLANVNTWVPTDSPRFFGKGVRAAAPRPFLRPAARFARAWATGVLTRHLIAGIRAFYGRVGLRAV